MGKNILAAAATLCATLALTGCAGALAPVSDPTPAPKPGDAREEFPHYETVVKPYVDGTELTCVRDADYGSVSCNWEAWNQARKTTTK